MSDIFISYASEDRSEAQKLAAALEAQGWSVWWDRTIPPGKNFDDVIEEALAASKCVIVVWSEAAVASRWVRAEAGEGSRRDILIPVMIQDVQPPLRFRQIHAAGLVDWQGGTDHAGFRQLVNALSGRLRAPASAEIKPALKKVGQEPEKSGTIFRDKLRDGTEGPEMVVLPAGEFMMGSPDSDKEAFGDEEPRHRVTISQPFAVGKYEVTFGEWDACVAGGGCVNYRPSDEDWGRGRRPVINVSWDDAKAHVAWLSQETEKAYRLLSEAEWEYAARAGTKTRYSFRDEISAKDANFGGNLGRTSDVGSYPANSWKLHDMHGNVWEWVEDCWNKSYDGAPPDGSAWVSSECSSRVLRGGSWFNLPGYLRSANRDGDNGADNRSLDGGFRVARTLP